MNLAIMPRQLTRAELRSPPRADRDRLLEQHAPMVKRIARHLMARLPETIQVDDLIQAGMMGLWEAIDKFDPAQGTPFESFASFRIRGSMLDEVRNNDWIPRSVHRKARQLSDAVREVEEREGRTAQDREVAEALEMSLDDYFRFLLEARGQRLVSLEALAGEDEADNLLFGDGRHDPFAEIQLRWQLAHAIGRMPERERMVLSLYYVEELNLREIGDVMGLTESRICQIHSQALVRLRARMNPAPHSADKQQKRQRLQ
jgi:RNA polymerase sigma factor FliA